MGYPAFCTIDLAATVVSIRQQEMGYILTERFTFRDILAQRIQLWTSGVINLTN